MNDLSLAPDHLWTLPSDFLQLGKGEVHVWRANMDSPEFTLQKFQRILAADELLRAEGFILWRDRRRFIVGRGLLRILLSRYLDVDPAELRFSYNPYGKPFLANESIDNTLAFSLSHSKNLVLYAVALNRKIGIDLEYIRFDFPWEEVARHFFFLQENAVLQDLPTDRKREVFFTEWTLKEAYSKAQGKGLKNFAQPFVVPMVAGESTLYLRLQAGERESSVWSFRHLAVGPGYAAALAVQGIDWQLKCWQVTD
jgi:4'-phosphopantetheinyl transferase